MALMIVVWKTPQDIDSFRRHYFEKQVLLAKKLPGLRKYEVSEEPITSPVGHQTFIWWPYCTSIRCPLFEIRLRARRSGCVRLTVRNLRLTHPVFKRFFSTPKSVE